MGKIKYIKKIREIFEKNPVVSITSLKKVISTPYLYVLLNYLVKKGEIKKITKGYYTISNDPILSVYCFKPAYIGLHDALGIHNLWEQETNVVIVTARKVRTGTRKILGSNVILRRISPKYFFGFEYVRLGDFYASVSDIDKTFIDMVYFKEKMDKELLQAFRKRINPKRLKSYMIYYPKRIKSRILGLVGNKK